jgi:hypothetical protein
LALCGCDRIEEGLRSLTHSFRSSGQRSAAVSDADRVLRKFGSPRERIGVGKAAHTENGIRYNRKWNYYYSTSPGKKQSMRTVYFLDDRFVGSVVHRPDGTIHRETVTFRY